MASGTSSPASSSDPPSSFSCSSKMVFRPLSTAFATLKDALAGTDNTIPQNYITQREGLLVAPGTHVITIPNFSAGLSMAPRWRRHSFHSLPIHVNGFNIEMQRYQSQKSSTSRVMGKMFISLTFQAMIGFSVLSFQSSSLTSLSNAQDQPPGHLLHLVEVCMLIGFTATLIGIILSRAFPVMASILEKTGLLVAALGFFLLISMFLPANITWIVWLACAFFVLAFIFYLTKPN